MERERLTSNILIFKKFKYRCQGCGIVYIVRKPEKEKCIFCGREKDFKKVFGKRERETVNTTNVFYKDAIKYVESIKPQIERLIPQDRVTDLVNKRTEIVKILRKKYGLSWTNIGKILKRDHSTIINLYRRTY